MKQSYFLVFVSLLIIFCLSFIPFGAIAQHMQPIVEPGIDLKIQLNASIDNGVTWHNYSGDGVAKGETLVVKPGDQIILRLSMWNTDLSPLTNITLMGEADKPQYFDGSVAFDNPDLDGDTIPYVGNWNGSFSMATLTGGGTEDTGNESGTMKFTVKSDAPEQTLVTCIAGVINYGHPTKENKASNLLAKIFGSGKARAQTGEAYSVVRVLISSALPQTGSAN
jgi:hypothetical protein